MSRRRPETSWDLLERARWVTETHERKEGTRWRPPDQLLKMYEEVGEVQRAIKDGKEIPEIGGEVADVIFAAITMFHVLGESDEGIVQRLSETLEKIEARALD